MKSKKRTTVSRSKDVGLIKCKHGMLPWSIVCIHLIHGESREWIQLPTDEPGSYDWICPECDKRWEQVVIKKQIDDLRPVCIVCVDELRARFDRNYKPVVDKFTATLPDGKKVFVKFSLEQGKEKTKQ